MYNDNYCGYRVVEAQREREREGGMRSFVILMVGVLLVVLGGGAAEVTQTLVSSPSRTRFVDVGTPTSYDSAREEGYPLLMILHGLGSFGDISAENFKVDEVMIVTVRLSLLVPVCVPPCDVSCSRAGR